MTQTSAEQQRLEDAARSIGAKLRTLYEGSSPDEQAALDAILSRAVAQDQGDDDDVVGYRFKRTGDLFEYLAAGVGTWIIYDPQPTPVTGWDFNKPDGGTTPPGSPHP